VPPRVRVMTAAYRKGIRHYPRVEGHGARPRSGRHADYQLTLEAATFRTSPGSVEYRVCAWTAKKVPGLPTVIGGCAGFLQSNSNG
jgi:hypothetical protein